MKKIVFLLLVGLFLSIELSAQIKLNAVVGAGSSSMKQFFNESNTTNLKPDYLLETGILASTKFRKEGMLGIQLGALYSYSGFRSFQPDWDATGSSFTKIIWKSNPDKIRSHFIKLPVTLDFNVYERFGLLVGGHLNLRLSSKENDLALFSVHGTSSSKAGYNTSIVGMHLGVYGNINKTMRVDAKVFNDIDSRLYSNGFSENNQFREFGFSLNFNYLLNP